MEEKESNLECKEQGLMKTIQLNDGKAGMQGLNKEMINKVIYEASKGTPYFNFQEKRQKSIDSKVNEYKSILSKITEKEKRAALVKMDAMGAILESKRDLSHSIVHIDMDAFYAAVEMEDNPSLKNKPMAVGSSSMLSTSNYEARKYGVRAAMPGFIAKKLCPSLVIVPCNFDKYKKVSNKVRNVVEGYDPDYCSASLDEMYFDLTNYIKDKHKKQLHSELCCKDLLFDSKDSSKDEECELSDYKNCQKCTEPISDEKRDQMAWYVVDEIRNRIFLETNLTASAGIAPNVMLAKVGSDQNKPNGQYQIPSTIDAVLSFVSTLPVKKVSGIGPVQGQILNALGIQTCADMWEMRDIVHLLFSSISSDFYIRVSRGISSTTVKSDYVRKSIGVERTFKEIYKYDELHEKCQELSDDAVEDLQMHNMLAKVVVLKFKTAEFHTHTRNQTLTYYSADKEVISKTAKRLLDLEIAAAAPKPLRLRLMGVRLANLVYEGSVPNIERHLVNIKTFLKNKSTINSEVSKDKCSDGKAVSSTSVSELAEFHENISSSTSPQAHSIQNHVMRSDELKPSVSNVEDIVCYSCPVCDVPQTVRTLSEFNTHIDSCLSINQDSDFKVEEQLSTSCRQIKSVEENAVQIEKTNPSQFEAEDILGYTCPVCNLLQKVETLSEFNAHIDSCLNKTTIKEILTNDQIKKRKINVEENQYAKRPKQVEKAGRKIEDYFR